MAASVVDLPEPVGPVTTTSPRCSIANFLSTGRQRRIEFFEVLEGKHAAGNLAEHGGDAVFLVEEVDAEARNVRNFVAEVHVAGFLELFDFVIRRDFVEHGLERIAFQRGIIHALKLAVDPQNGRVAGRHVQVGRLLLEH